MHLMVAGGNPQLDAHARGLGRAPGVDELLAGGVPAQRDDAVVTVCSIASVSASLGQAMIAEETVATAGSVTRTPPAVTLNLAGTVEPPLTVFSTPLSIGW